jgi:hypothetical protein
MQLYWWQLLTQSCWALMETAVRWAAAQHSCRRPGQLWWRAHPSPRLLPQLPGSCQAWVRVFSCPYHRPGLVAVAGRGRRHAHHRPWTPHPAPQTKNWHSSRCSSQIFAPPRPCHALQGAVAAGAASVPPVAHGRRSGHSRPAVAGVAVCPGRRSRRRGHDHHTPSVFLVRAALWPAAVVAPADAFTRQSVCVGGGGERQH